MNVTEKKTNNNMKTNMIKKKENRGVSGGRTASEECTFLRNELSSLVIFTAAVSFLVMGRGSAGSGAI